MKSINEHYGLEDEDISCSRNYKTILQDQQKDKELIKIPQINKDCSIHNFRGGNKKLFLICKNNKIVIPK